MPRSQYKNTNLNSQDNSPPPEASNLITVGTEKCSVADAQDKALKIAIVDRLKDLKKGVNKSLNEVWKYK